MLNINNNNRPLPFHSNYWPSQWKVAVLNEYTKCTISLLKAVDAFYIAVLKNYKMGKQ